MLWDRLKIVLVFAIAGPILGGWFACPLFACAAELASDGPLLPQVPKILGFCAVFGPFGGFVVGLAPAVVTGLILAWRLPHVATMREAAATGFLVTLAVLGFGYVFVLVREETVGSSSVLLPVSLISAAIASAACWRLVGALPPKPKRLADAPVE